MTETTTVKAKRKPPDIVALYLADVRREIRKLERLERTLKSQRMESVFDDRARWLARVDELTDPAATSDLTTMEKAVEACAALFFAARGAERGAGE